MCVRSGLCVCVSVCVYIGVADDHDDDNVDYILMFCSRRYMDE